MKNTLYFPHDFHARHDPKLEKLLLSLKAEGIGIYWILIEMLFEQEGYLQLSDINYYAEVIRTNNETITKVIMDYGLFENDKKRFWSNSALQRLNHIIEKRHKATESINKRWHNNTEVIRTNNEGNTIRVNKSIVNKNIKEHNIEHKDKYGEFNNVLLTNDELDKLNKLYGKKGTELRIEALSAYIDSKGKKYKNHYSTILTWESMHPSQHPITLSEEVEIRSQAQIDAETEYSKLSQEEKTKIQNERNKKLSILLNNTTKEKKQ